MPSRTSSSINHITIVGTGLMGTGIAQIGLEAGVHVVLVGRSEEKCQKAAISIRMGVTRAAKKRIPDNEEAQAERVNNVMSWLTTTTSLEEGVSNAEVVLEAVVENLKVKQRVLAEIEQFARNDCILVTNTSSFLLTDVASKLNHREKFAGLHFFNPVPVMKLVEVVRTAESSEHTYQTLLEFCRRLGKTTVSSKDTSGFIVNRLLIPYLMEAMRMSERGDASKEDIDIAMKLGAGHPMGPFEIADFVGLDTIKFIMDEWHQQYPHDTLMEPNQTLDRLVSEGKLGRKTGQGFYKHTK